MAKKKAAQAAAPMLFEVEATVQTKVFLSPKESAKKMVTETTNKGNGYSALNAGVGQWEEYIKSGRGNNITWNK